MQYIVVHTFGTADLSYTAIQLFVAIEVSHGSYKQPSCYTSFQEFWRSEYQSLSRSGLPIVAYNAPSNRTLFNMTYDRYYKRSLPSQSWHCLKQLAQSHGFGLPDYSLSNIALALGIGEPGRDMVLQAEAIVAATEWFIAKEQPPTLEALWYGHFAPAAPIVVASAGLEGKSFVLTGTLNALTRAEAAAKIIAAGGQVSETVSTKTDYLVVGTQDHYKTHGYSSKEKKAHLIAQQGGKIVVLNEVELIKLISPK